MVIQFKQHTQRENAEKDEIIAALKEKIAEAAMREKTFKAFGINEEEWEITESLKRLELLRLWWRKKTNSIRLM